MAQNASPQGENLMMVPVWRFQVPSIGSEAIAGTVNAAASAGGGNQFADHWFLPNSAQPQAADALHPLRKRKSRGELTGAKAVPQRQLRYFLKLREKSFCGLCVAWLPQGVNPHVNPR